MISSILLKKSKKVILKCGRLGLSYRENSTDSPDANDFESTSFDAKQLLNFKKVLRSQNINFKDGYTCIQTECRMCSSRCSQAFMNKTTGKWWAPTNDFIHEFTFSGALFCPTCEVNKPLSSVIQSYMSSTRRDTTALNTKRYEIQEFLDSLTPSTEVLESLMIHDLKSDILKKLGVIQNCEKGSLHFPLKNVAGICTGERILYYSRDFEEETLPPEKCSGLLCHTNSKATKAILVLSIMDFLALCSQKLDDCE